MNPFEPYAWYYCDTKHNECNELISTQSEHVRMTRGDCERVCVPRTMDEEQTFLNKVQNIVQKLLTNNEHVFVVRLTTFDGVVKTTSVSLSKSYNSIGIIVHGGATCWIHTDKNTLVVHIDHFFYKGGFTKVHDNPLEPVDCMNVIECIALGFVTTEDTIRFEVTDEHRLERNGTMLHGTFWLLLKRGYSYYEGRGFVERGARRINYADVNETLGMKMKDVFSPWDFVDAATSTVASWTVREFVDFVLDPNVDKRVLKKKLQEFAFYTYTARTMLRVQDMFMETFSDVRGFFGLEKRIRIRGNIKLFMKYRDIDIVIDDQ